MRTADEPGRRAGIDTAGAGPGPVGGDRPDVTGALAMDRREPRADDVRRALAALAAPMVVMLTTACAAILCARRLSGGLPAESRPLGLALATLVGSGLVIAAELATQRVPRGRRTGPRWTEPRKTGLAWAARAALACGLAALVPPWPWPPRWWPAVAAAGGALVGVTLIAPRGAGFRGVGPSRQRGGGAGDRGRSTAPGTPAADTAGAAPSAGPVGADAVPATGGAPASFASRETPVDDADALVSDSPSPPRGASLSHRFTRFTRPIDEADCLLGEMVVVVPAGERVAPGHLAFCPPFATSPEIAVEAAADAAEVEAAAVEVLPWGARIECRLEEATDEPVTVTVSLSAVAAAPPSPADD